MQINPKGSETVRKLSEFNVSLLFKITNINGNGSENMAECPVGVQNDTHCDFGQVNVLRYFNQPFHISAEYENLRRFVSCPKPVSSAAGPFSSTGSLKTCSVPGPEPVSAKISISSSVSAAGDTTGI